MKNDEHYIELINKEIDGLISSKEKTDLSTYLKENPEVKKLYEDLRRTADLLKQTPEFDPSPNLKKRIINSLDFDRYPITSKKGSLLKNWISQLFTAPKPRLAYIFAIGIIAGFFIHLLFFTNQTEQLALREKDLYGTMGTSEKENFKLVDKIQVELPDISGTIEIRQLDYFITLTIILFSQNKYELSVKYDYPATNFVGIKPSQMQEFIFQNRAEILRITHNRKTDYTLLFQRSVDHNPLFEMKIFMFDRLLWSKEKLVILEDD